MVDIGNAGGRLVDKREVPGAVEVVDGDGSRPLVGGGAAWEAAGSGSGSGSGRSRVAGDRVGSRPCCVGRKSGVGRSGARIDAGLRA